MTDITLKIIGDKLGGRDHSTIMNGIKRIEKKFSILKKPEK